MKDKELKLNASGYYDEPCYKAMTDPPKPGEIWENGNTGKLVLVLANTNAICSILNLTEQDKENRIKVTARVPMYTAPYMVCYCFESNLTGFVKRVKDEEYTAVKKAVANVLGLEGIAIPAVPHDHINELEEKIISQEANISLLKKQVKLLEDERNKAMILADGIHAEQITLSKDLGIEKAKSEVYREMFDALIDNVISAMGGSVNE